MNCTDAVLTPGTLSDTLPEFEMVVVDEATLADLKALLDTPTTSSNCKKLDYLTYRAILRDILCDRTACIMWLMKYGLLSFSQKCPLCENTMKLTKEGGNDGIIWRCSKQRSGDRHYKRISIRAGSLFEKSNLTLETVVQLIYMWARQYPTRLVRQELCISPSTQIGWFRSCREVCETYLEELSQPVGGPGAVVEIEQVRFSKSRLDYQKDKYSSDSWVLGGVEQNTFNVFLVPVEDKFDETFSSLIAKWIKPGSTMICSCSKFYKRLKKLKLKDIAVSHTKHFSEAGSNPAPTSVEWQEVKKKLQSTCSVHRSHVSDYLAEYLWRMKIHDEPDKFLSFLGAVRYVFPVHEEPSLGQNNSCESQKTEEQ